MSELRTLLDAGRRHHHEQSYSGSLADDLGVRTRSPLRLGWALAAGLALAALGTAFWPTPPHTPTTAGGGAPPPTAKQHARAVAYPRRPLIAANKPAATRSASTAVARSTPRLRLRMPYRRPMRAEPKTIM